MRKLTLFLTIALVLTCGSALLASNTAVVSIDGITGLAPAPPAPTANMLRAGQSHTISIRYNLAGLLGKWSTGNAWELYSPEGADWGNLVAADGPFTTGLPAEPAGPSRYHKYYRFTAGPNFVAQPTIVNPIDPDTGEPFSYPVWTTEPGGRTGGVTKVAYSLAVISTGGLGYQAPNNGIALNLTFSTRNEDAGMTMCVDTVNTQGTVKWEWGKPGAPADYPQYDGDPFTAGIQPGPICLEIFFVPNLPPVWCNGLTGEVTFNHCAVGSFPLCATDGGDGPGPMTYSFAPGFETGYGQLVGPNWTWSGATVPHSGDTYIHFLANDGTSPTGDEFVLHVINTNNEPTITCPEADMPMAVQVGKCKELVVEFSDDNCDQSYLQFAVLAGDYSMDSVHVSGTGLSRTVQFCPDGLKRTVTMPVTVTYVNPPLEPEVATCNLIWNVTLGSDYQVQILKIEQAFQGQLTVVPIQLDAATFGLGGFDLLMAYDASALAFQKAEKGAIYTECGWEYFTYRYGAYGNCNGACPSGLLRIIGMAETNNGGLHPLIICNPIPVTIPTTLANLTFLVSNDRNLECQYAPVRFFWYECGDNALSNWDGSILYLEEGVYDFKGLDVDAYAFNSKISSDDSDSPFPTFLGTQDICVCDLDDPTCKVAAVRAVAFQNGGVDIACADLIDDRGDINMNGLGYEIADAVMFTNYFMKGISAFADCTGLDNGDPADPLDDLLTRCLHQQQGAIAASDTNADGLALTVADLVYLIRVIIGDAQAYDKVSPVAANVAYGNGIFSVDAEMGAAHIVMSGDVTPTLLVSNMEIKFASDGENTRILVFSIEGNSFSGDFLRAEGSVISTEFASATGQPVVAKVMPTEFALHQNYPNPFNPTTTIKIDVPKNGANWTLNVYNVTGQLVQTMSGNQAGFQEVVWDASNNASGIYFYKLTAGDYSATKKAILLK